MKNRFLFNIIMFLVTFIRQMFRVLADIGFYDSGHRHADKFHESCNRKVLSQLKMKFQATCKSFEVFND